MSRRPPSLPPEDEPPPEPPEPVPVRHRLGSTRVFVPDNPNTETPDPNDVFETRRLNLDQEKARTDELLPPLDRSARRRHWRDYWMVILSGNGMLALAAWLIPGLVSWVFIGSGMILLTLAVTWIYVFVIDPR